MTIIYLFVCLFVCFVLFFSSVNSSCTNGEIRLVNGSSDREGRVEVCIGNTWTAVSEYGWDYREAQVVCRQLDLPYQCMPLFTDFQAFVTNSFISK